MTGEEGVALAKQVRENCFDLLMCGRRPMCVGLELTVMVAPEVALCVCIQSVCSYMCRDSTSLIPLACGLGWLSYGTKLETWWVVLRTSIPEIIKTANSSRQFLMGCVNW